MAVKKRAGDPNGQPTQETPKGLEIPVPKRRDVMAGLRRIAVARGQDRPPSIKRTDK